MTELIGSSTLGAIAAMGYAFAKTLLVGLAASGWWLYPLLAAASLAYCALRPIADAEAPFAFFRQVLAVALAALLLYGYKSVDLGSVVGDRLGGGTGEVAQSQGAAPLPTYLVDLVGSAVAGTAKQIFAQREDLLVPMLSSVVPEAAAHPANLADAQVSANLSIWRFVAAAALQADSTLAQRIHAQGLMPRLQNPLPPNPDYSSEQAARQAEQVAVILDSANANARLAKLVCANAAMINKLAADYGGTSWVAAEETLSTRAASGLNNLAAEAGGTSRIEPDGCQGSVSLRVVSSTTLDNLDRARAPGSPSDPALAAKAARGAAALEQLIGEHRAAITQTRFDTLGQVYRALGAAALAGPATQAGQEDAFKVALGEQCAQKGARTCLGSFAPVFHALGEEVEAKDRSHKDWKSQLKEHFVDGGFKRIAGLIAFVVGLLMTLFAKLVAALTPFAIAMARALAIVVSILGVYLLLLPGRFGDGLTWMIGPIAWANLWSVLFVVWRAFSERFLDWGYQLFRDAALFSGDGISSAAVIQFVVAVGYTALPVYAWALVFGRPHRFAPHGGVGRMLAPALLAGLAATGARAAWSKVWTKPSESSAAPAPAAGGPGAAVGGAIPSNSPAPARAGPAEPVAQAAPSHSAHDASATVRGPGSGYAPAGGPVSSNSPSSAGGPSAAPAARPAPSRAYLLSNPPLAANADPRGQ